MMWDYNSFNVFNFGSMNHVLKMEGLWMLVNKLILVLCN